MTKINIINIDLPKNKYNIKAPNSMNPIGITIHETDNNASARNEIAYMHRNNLEVSYHFAVDEKEFIQGLPLNRNGWHAGDGHGTGNRKTIAIEICRNLNRSDNSIPDEYYRARANAEKLAGYLLYKYGWTDKDIYTHNDWNGKNCPRQIRKQGYLSTFKKNAMTWKKIFAGEEVEAPKPSKPKYKEVTAKVVNDVINGKYGNGAERKKKLEEAGYNYKEVQDVVNRSYGAKPQAKPKPKPQSNKVTVKKTATHFATGQKMDDWVKGYTFDVEERKSDRTLITNKGTIIGWVKNSDLVGADKAPQSKPKPSFKKYKLTLPSGTKLYNGRGKAYPAPTTRKHTVTIHQEKDGMGLIKEKWLVDVTQAWVKLPKKSTSIKRGDKIKIKAGAKDLNKNIKFASWVYNNTMYVLEVQKRGYVFSDKKHGGVIGVVGRNQVSEV